MRQTLNAALTPGQAIMIDVRAAAFIQRAVPGLVPPTVTISEPSGVAGNFGVPTLPGHLPPLSEVTINARLWPLNPNASFPAWQRFLQPDQPPSTEGRLVEFRLPLGQDRMVPTQTNYQFEVVVSGVYIGTIPPIVVSTAVVSVA
jgi:hypothetical protein